MANVKLRPLVVHDSASSQSAFSDSCTAELSSSVRVHSVLPSTARAKLVPSPPDTGTCAAEDTGVSKLRSKLRRLLGANSSSHGHPVQKGATPSQTAALRCGTAADLNDRSVSSANGTRAATSVPASPNVAASGGPRGRFFGSIVVTNTASSSSSTGPATPVSGSASPNIQGPRAPGPVPPSTAPNGATPTPRCPSANSGRSPALRRAVSFSPTATTFPPLNAPSVPSPPPPAAPGGGAATAGAVVAAGAFPTGSSRTLTASSTFNTGSGRMSNMVVVPEDEALPEDAAQGDLCLPLSGGSIAGIPPRGPALIAECLLRGSRVSAADPDILPGVAPSSPSPSFHYDTAPYINTPPAVAAPSVQLSPARVSPSGLDGHHGQRISSGSSSSTFAMAASGNGYVEAGNYTHSAASLSAAANLTSWPSEAFSALQNAAVAATAAILESSPSPAAPSPSSPQHLRSLPLKPTSRASLELGRPPSSPSSAAAGGGGCAAVAAAAATAAPPPRGGASYHHLQAVASGSPGQAASQVHVSNHHASTPAAPAISRGMSAITLLVSNGGGGSSGGRCMASGASPWGAVSGGSASVSTATNVVAPEAPMTPPMQQPVGAGAGFDSRAMTPTSPKQQALRRAHSTIDHTSKSQPEVPSGPPGVLMALGASLPSDMRRKEWRIEDFTMLKRLYKGNYSAVHKALCRISMRLVVIKTYDTTRMTELARNHVKREATLHAPLEHENILNLYAVFSQGPYVMLVEEVAEGGDLYHVLKSIPGHRLQEDRAVAGVLVPLLRSLSYLHELGICHRDIKLENILFGDRQHTRMLLADFGIALSMRLERAVTRAGTTEYMSPEQLRCPFKRHPADNKERTDLHYGLGVDVWATGVLAYELLHGYPPFLGSHREETEQLILTAEVQVATQLSHGARDFILSCLNKDPADRPTVMQLLQHPWIRQHARVLR